MAIHKLTAAKILRLNKNGMYGDGGGLWLQVTANGAGKSWVFRWTRAGKERVMGLGPIYKVDLHEARGLAKKQWGLIEQGKDPIEEREGIRLDEAHSRGLVKTVNEVIDEYLTHRVFLAHRSRHTKASAILMTNTIRETIGLLPIQKIDTKMILDAVGLRRMWTDKHITARHLMGYLKQIFALAIASGYYRGANPAQWDNNLGVILPDRNHIHTVKHHPSLPYKDVGRFMQALRDCKSNSSHSRLGVLTNSYVAEFIVLTGARPGEVIGATWDEFDRIKLIWTIPAARHKTGPKTKKPIVRPISKPMLAVLDEMERLYPQHTLNAPVFPGFKKPFYSRNSCNMFIRQTLKWPGISTHGFRSTLIEWVREEHPERPEWVHLWELQVQHAVGDKVTQAYDRTTLFNQRRIMMEAWGEYCSRPTPEPIEDGSNVINMRRNAL